MTLAGVISLKKQDNISAFTVISVPPPLFVPFSHHLPFSLLHSLPLLLDPPFSRSVFLLYPPRPIHRTHAGWSAQSVVLFNMHSPFLLLYYCPTGGGGPFLWPDNGRRRDREHGGHVPFATPCYLSILPPFSPAIRFSIAP